MFSTGEVLLDCASVEETSEQEMKRSEKEERNGISESIFRGSDNPKRPELKWFAHDENIKGLIEMRCNDINSIQTKTLKLSGSSSATMSKKVACAIDAAVGKFGGKASVKGEGSMEAQASSESKSTLIFYFENLYIGITWFPFIIIKDCLTRILDRRP